MTTLADTIAANEATLAEHELVGRPVPAVRGEHDCRIVGPGPCGCKRIIAACTACDWTAEADGKQGDAHRAHLATILAEQEAQRRKAERAARGGAL